MSYLSKYDQVRSKTPHKTKSKKKPKHKIKTPIPVSKKCACGCKKDVVFLSIHHVFFGSGQRELSSLHYCVEYLCFQNHQDSHGIHGSKTPNFKLDYELKVKHQNRLMNEGMSIKTFRSLFGMNYVALTLEEYIDFRLKELKVCKKCTERETI